MWGVGGFIRGRWGQSELGKGQSGTALPSAGSHYGSNVAF